MAIAEYQFTLILNGIGELTDEVLDRLYEAGCDDALFGTRAGIVLADFAREATSLTEAVLSAARDVDRAKVGGSVVHVEPDELVTMAEIGRRLGVSREAVRKWVVGVAGPGRFPPPVGRVSQKSPLWRWTDVLTWHQAGATNGGTAPKGTPRSGRHEARGGERGGKGKDNPGSPVPHDLQSSADMAALNAALDLLRYTDPDTAMHMVAFIAESRR